MAADVNSNLASWSTSEASNSPSGSTAISTNLDDNLRQIQAVVRKYLATKGSDLASATTTDLSTTDGNFIDITGTTTITGFGTLSAGMWKVLQFDGALTLTHNGTSLILPTGANITTVAGDCLFAVSLGSGNWLVPFYSRGTPFVDSGAIVVGSSDQTKKLRFEVDGFTTGNTRVLTVPDASTTIVGTDVAQTLTSKTLTSPVINTGASGTAFADQTAMEAASSTSTFVSPGVAHYHPGMAKAWCTFNGATTGTNAPTTGYNVTSVQRHSTGVYTVNFTTSFSSAEYAMAGFAQDNSGNSFFITSNAADTRSVSAKQIRSKDVLGGESDCEYVSVIFFGDQ